MIAKKVNGDYIQEPNQTSQQGKKEGQKELKSFKASEIILIQSIEAVDEDGDILSFEERREANTALEGEGAGSPLEALSARADVLSQQVKRRAPWLWQTTHQFSTLPWFVTFGCALLAMFLGASVQVLNGGKTFHILSVPLLGLIIWNFFSLSLLFLGPRILKYLLSSAQETKDSRWGRSALSFFLWLQQKWVDWRKPTTGGHVQNISLRAWREYWKEWPTHASELLRAQCSRALHLSTMVFGLSALFTAYSSGLTKAYRATRESTFLGTTQVEFILQFVFTPSQWILGPLPSLKSAKMGLLGPAAPWIHHYAVTLLLFVLLPRLVLFAWTWLQSVSLTARLPLSMKALDQIPTLNIALASHTNVGKTSLARTLLRRDVGEVRDAKHVTRRRAGYFLINTPEVGLRLWDTPGFDDAKALTKNLQEREGWAWLRGLQEPTLRFDREAALSLREEADLILYLVPAHGGTEVERTLRDEWGVLREIQCPVLCLLNRLHGANPSEEKKFLAYWKDFFAQDELCQGVLSLDAFSRSIEDEQALFEAIERAVKPEKKAIATQCREIWKDQNKQRHQAASSMIASTLKQLSLDKEREAGKSSGQKLQSRAQKVIAKAQGSLLEQMGLKGEIRDRMLDQSEAFLHSIIPNRGERTVGAIIGGALSGLATGITTDFLAGGLTFFGGAAIGMVVGAIGGMGVAEGYRRTGKRGSRELVWEQDFLQGVTLRLTLLYLAAASFGRAKGEFTDEVFLASTSEPMIGEQEETDESLELIAVAKHQALLFQAAQTALEIHWPYLWPFLEKNHGPKPKKIWEKVLPGIAGKPDWVENITRQDEALALPVSQEREMVLEYGDPFEKGCTALLHEALEQWNELRQE